jgi:hypothetical protein
MQQAVASVVQNHFIAKCRFASFFLSLSNLPIFHFEKRRKNFIPLYLLPQVFFRKIENEK